MMVHSKEEMVGQFGGRKDAFPKMPEGASFMTIKTLSEVVLNSLGHYWESVGTLPNGRKTRL